MFNFVLHRLFGTPNDKIVKKLRKQLELVKKFNFSHYTNADFALKTKEFIKHIQDGQDVNTIKHEALALVKEAAARVLNLHAFDVQLIGALVLDQGQIAEMKTGEGKTLVATLAVYLNALSGKGVHVVTINDYLAKRDAEWMGKVYELLGLSVGCIYQGMSEEDKRAAYLADITYGTNNEFAFDYLRDNLKYSTEQMMQRPFHFAVIDEVDSILIDEARTPLIISGASDSNTELYPKINKLLKNIAAEYFVIDEKNKSAHFSDTGCMYVEELFKKHGMIAESSSLYDLENMTLVHHANQALRAHHLFKKDVDYIVKNDAVMLIDEFTGRIMDGRRYSEGLHQALEAKEGVKIQNENQTVASITFQNYFRMYPKLAGMTGTAATEAQEFFDIYRLKVVAIPTNIPVKRIDQDDRVYLSMLEKDKAVIQEIKAAYTKGQPVLVGTISIERSEYLSNLLNKEKIPHSVLNARFHEQEAEIIAQAGRKSAVTIATNMAGRGTDIKLGGNAEIMLKQAVRERKLDDPIAIEQLRQEIINDVAINKEEVLSLGGMLVVATERHEARRIDNQLRGRSGRQGDPGRTIFYLSLEDDLLRIFGSEKLQSVFRRMRIKEDEAIEASILSRSIEKAQLKIEARNYEVRKNLLRFDDVMNEQRQVIYEQRRFIMLHENILELCMHMARMTVEEKVNANCHNSDVAIDWDLTNLAETIYDIFAIPKEPILNWQQDGREILISYLQEQITIALSEKVKAFDTKEVNEALRYILIMTMDYLWKEHLHHLDHLRTGIGLRAYGQKNPLSEYKIETFTMFNNLLAEIEKVSLERVFRVKFGNGNQELSEKIKEAPVINIVETASVIRNKNKTVTVDPSTWANTPRNALCPCGSGKRYKNCHGKL